MNDRAVLVPSASKGKITREAQIRGRFYADDRTKGERVMVPTLRGFSDSCRLRLIG